MNAVFTEIAKSGLIVPVFVEDLSEIKQKISALSKGGIFCAEADVRSLFFKQIVSGVQTLCPNLLLGVGNVSSEKELEEALASGASFYTVSYGLFLSTLRDRTFLIPVCTTEEEVKQAVNAGAPLIQISAKLNGIARIFNAYKNVRFILSDATDISAYASLPQVAAIKIKAGTADVYFRAVQALLGYDLRHVGINCKDEEESARIAEQFETLFGFPKEDRGGAYFAGNVIEVMKKPFYGKHGHIAIITNSAERAAYYLEKKGVALNWQSAGYNPDGRLRVVYLQKETGGFALHILQK